MTDKGRDVAGLAAQIAEAIDGQCYATRAGAQINAADFEEIILPCLTAWAQELQGEAEQGKGWALKIRAAESALADANRGIDLQREEIALIGAALAEARTTIDEWVRWYHETAALRLRAFLARPDVRDAKPSAPEGEPAAWAVYCADGTLHDLDEQKKEADWKGGKHDRESESKCGPHKLEPLFRRVPEAREAPPPGHPCGCGLEIFHAGPCPPPARPSEFADSPYVCCGCKRQVPENVPCPFCSTARPSEQTGPSERDFEWWAALCMNDAIAMEPEAVKAYVLALEADRLREIAGLLRECVSQQPHAVNPPKGCLCRWCKSRRFLATHPETHAFVPCVRPAERCAWPTGCHYTRCGKPASDPIHAQPAQAPETSGEGER